MHQLVELMNKRPSRMILGGRDLIETVIRPVLRPHMGVAAEVVDLVPILEAALDEYLCDPQRALRQRPSDFMIQYRVPSEIAKQTEAKLIASIAMQLQAGFGFVYPGRQYVYRFVGSSDIRAYEGDVVIEEIGE